MDLRTLTRLSLAALALASVALAGCSKTEEPTAPEGGAAPAATTAAPGATTGAPGTTPGAPAKSETPKIEGAAGSATPQ